MQAPDGTQSRILIRDTWNTDIRQRADTRGYGHHRLRAPYSAFYQTELDEVPTRLNVRYLVVTGCTTSVCVESTIRDAMFREYSCVPLADCAAEPVGDGLSRTNHEAPLLVIQTVFGWVSDSECFLRAIKIAA